MFLDRISQLRLLEHDPEANILLNFSLPVRKVLVKEVTNFLLSPATPGNVLSTRAHAIYVLETCGQGFRLPIEEADSIQEVIELYRIWILEPRRRPAPIDQEFQYFLQTMLKHFSLLFASRSDAVVERHMQLCNSVLDIFLAVGRVLEKKLSEETWEVFLKLLIGIADSLFISPKDPSLLGLKLCNQVLKVLFECWLHSRTQNPQMWKYLKDRVPKWTNLSKTITHWQSFSLALTGRLLRLMYGPGHGTDAVTVRLDSEQYVLNLEDNYVFYAWHRILTILDDLNNIQNPNNFLQAFQGVESLVGEFMAVQKKLPPNVIPPDGNTILHVFGKWLFEAIQLSRQGFDEGTALAIKVVSNIFNSKRETKFVNTYLASYYRSLQEVLIRDGKTLIAAILYSRDIFSRQMEGSRILVQYYIYAITRIVVGNLSSEPFFVSKGVRSACCTILGQIFCLPKYFGNTEFKLKFTYKEKQAAVKNYQTGTLSSSATPPPKSVFEASTYAELKPHLDYVLLEALKNEQSVENILNLQQLCYAHAITYIDDPEFARNVISTICGKCVTPKKWSPGVIYSGLKTVGRMSFLFSQLGKSKELAKKIISPLCGFVKGLCQDLFRARGGVSDKQKVRLAVQTFKTIADWVTVDQWIVEYPDRMKIVLDAVSIGLLGPKQKTVTEVEPESKKSKKDKSKKEKEKKEIVVAPVVTSSKKITRAANELLVTLLNRMGVFPSERAGATSVSSLVSEDELLQDIAIKAEKLGVMVDDPKQFLRCFLLAEQTILSVVDQPFEENGPTVTVIFRDCTGKYSWQFRSAFLPFDERSVPSRTKGHCAVEVPISREPHRTSVDQLEDDKFPDIYEAIDQKKWPFDPLEFAADMQRREMEYLESVEYNLNHSITLEMPPPADPYVSACKFQQGRLLLAHLGLISLENWGKIHPLEQTQNLFAQMKILDQVPERRCHRIAVVNVRRGQRYGDFEAQDAGNIDFQEFLCSLGWGMHIPTHTGYLGNLERNAQLYGEYAPYYADHKCELLFEVASLMPNNPNQSEQTHKSRLLASAPVVIVWTENSIDEYEPDFGKSNKAHIVIQHLMPTARINLYRVRLFLKVAMADNKIWGPEYKEVLGPCLEGTVLSKDRLGALVRETAMEACTVVEGSDAKKSVGDESQYALRARVIGDIAKKFRTVEPLESFYTSIFTSLPSKFVIPMNSCTPARADRALRSELPGVANQRGSGSQPRRIMMGYGRSNPDLKKNKGKKKKLAAEGDYDTDGESERKSKSSKSRRKKHVDSTFEETPLAKGSGGDGSEEIRSAKSTTWAVADGKMSSHRDAPSKSGDTKAEKPIIVAMSSQRMQGSENPEREEESSPVTRPPRPSRGPVEEEYE